MVFHKKQLAMPHSQGAAFKKSFLAMCVVALSAPSFAQDSTGDGSGIVEEIVVSGMRQSLQSAQDVKRNADTFVDSITASDISALPDRSVLESMQRLPGVSIERFQASDDPDHFSVEGSGAVIRGMTATRSEFNGRDSFTANSGRGLSWQDIPPELMAGVDLYKNQSADMVEGGIGGTVSLRTRKPFDSGGRVISLSGDVTWGDLAEETTPTVSALFSDRWDTAAGEFGLLVNLAHSELTGVSHGIQSDVYKRYGASWIAGAERFVGDGTGQVWMPQASNLLMKEDERERSGQAVAFQWRDPNQTWEATLQYLRSDATLSWWENALKYQGGYADANRATRPYEGTEFLFNDRGLFMAGFMAHGSLEPGQGENNPNNPGNPWRATSQGGPDLSENVNLRIPNAYSGPPNGMRQFGQKFQVETRGQVSNTVVEDAAFNLKWTPDEAWEFVLDYQNVRAETTVDDLVVHLGLHALQRYDATGDTPWMELVEPWNGQRDNNPDLYPNSPGFSNDPQGDKNYFQDITSYWYRSAMDHYERSDGESNAIRLDGTHFFEDLGLLKSVKAGLRWAEREQTVRFTSWNWGSLAPEFSAGTLFLDHVPEQAGAYELVDWSDFHRGDTIHIPGNSLIHPTRDFVADLRANPNCDRAANKNNGSGAPAYSQGGSWLPYPCRADVDGKFGIFTPDEIFTTTETNTSAYLRVDFGSDETALRFNGNIGFRYVKLEREAQGYVVYPELFRNQTAAERTPAGLPEQLTGPIVLAYAQQQVDAGHYADLDSFYEAPENRWVGYAQNYLPLNEQRFGDGTDVIQTAISDYSKVLPSLNLKIELSDDLISRVAISKAIALPDMELVRNRVTLGAREIVRVQGEPHDPEAEDVPTWQTALQSARIEAWDGSGGNPFLKPMESIQYDVSLEWYFSNVGSLTGTLFHKDLSNFFVKGATPQVITNPTTGITQTVEVDATRNGGDGSMTGFELAYQQFFDMLPAPWDGFGIQANYTYIEASGVPNNEYDSYADEPGYNPDTDTGARVSMERVPLQGQSKHTANFVAMYEKNDWSVRLAYNWRSKYLLTTRDVISKYPLWNDDAGFLDGSVFYNINDNIKVGVQFTNLLNTQSKTIMILDDQGTEAGRSWFVQDRRASFVVRANF